MINLDGKKALVTGASRGIGKAIAIRLATEGVSVGVNYNASEQEAAKVVDEIQSLGGNAIVLKGSVADSLEVQSLIQAAEDKLGGLDILVNNAGITKDNLIMRLPEEDWDQVIDTNLKGAFLCTKAALRSMVRQRSGRIINMSSVVAITGNAGQSNYTAAKAGLIGFTKTVAKEVASRGITVNAIAPGFIETQMVDAISSQLQEKILERIALGYFGTPEDVAGVVAFLASEDARYVTGQVIGIDGGLSL
ncbi:MAG: 3-oxoacyl-[acyl-carrier-protein] reductase [Chloroflexi bacterium]|nr:3-oxoacyl-[acyl-carrier-protein] reductase [Chloroflexota bacterium]|tara:strand:+ start:1389 stop:2135 length:747 start_codon:yes stop_codon:yes gene_type:complete